MINNLLHHLSKKASRVNYWSKGTLQESKAFLLSDQPLTLFKTLKHLPLSDLLKGTFHKPGSRRPQKIIRDAVTAVFTCKDQVFMIRRSVRLNAFPGYHAFPGGKVDANEPDTPLDLPFLKDHSPHIMRALCRELKEELNFDLEASIKNEQVVDFVDLGIAVTPEYNPNRFNTYFFRIELTEPIAFSIDPHETEFQEWELPQNLLQQYHQGQLLMVPPAIKIIEAFTQRIPNPHMEKLFKGYDPKQQMICAQFLYQVYQLPVLSRTLPPAKATNAFIIGDPSEGAYLIDPSPYTEDEYNKLKKALASFNIAGIFITHHHPDHHEFSTRLARELNLPLWLSNDTHERIIEKWGKNYFNNIVVNHAQEGDVLTKWLGHEVLVHEIPGHDEGQLGLAPVSKEWFIVGDLIQGIGTVVIGQPEGNMKKYFESLARIIKMNPAVIIPSHGIPTRSTYRLEVTLEHRKMRERQVLNLHQKGYAKDQILAEIYKDVDPRLLPFALKNIEAHFEKLSLEHQL
ncbi:MBL fold metallo-hydrolase [Deltaproteobacteria bacterium TL4]